MSVTYDLFIKWKDLKKFNSERKALIALGMSSGAAVHWKNGRNADTDIIERMAKDLGENAAMWAAMAMQERCQGEPARAWRRIARQLGATLTILLSVGITSQEKTQIHQQHAISDLYIMRNNVWLRRLWRSLKQALSPARHHHQSFITVPAAR